MKTLPKIALTMGDPAGIGPELVVRAATNAALRKIADISIYGCPDIIAKASAKFADKESPIFHPVHKPSSGVSPTDSLDSSPGGRFFMMKTKSDKGIGKFCLLYTSDAADE